MQKGEEIFVVLVDERDRPQGVMEKMAAHRQGALHRAISVQIVDYQDCLLLQQRAGHKYHTPLLWTNTACSHPLPDEDTEMAAKRRLFEEMGLKLPLRRIGSFIYRAEFANGLTEYEFDHLFLGEWDGEPPAPDPDEVEDYCWMPIEKVEAAMAAHPEQFTPWFAHILPLIAQALRVRRGSKQAGN